MDGERVMASLPEVYAALMADSVASFPALRPHQRHAWHAFLVQLGALVLHRSYIDTPFVATVVWAGALRRLTARFPQDEPWCLVVDDITRPALLQPPSASAEHAVEYKHEISTPDELDMLRTAKNHDIKSSVATKVRADDWMFALLTVQTMDGFEGAGNYGISRMNGGMGSRPAFSLAPVGGIGAHVRRDMVALADRRADLLDTYPLSDNGHALLWTIPWDGTAGEGLFPTSLDPFYIEICRRIRLRSDTDGQLRGVRATSKQARIAAKELNGRTGDPWTPVNLKEGKSLTLAAGGFAYKRIRDYLTPGDYQQPILLAPTQTEQASGVEMWLVARGMVRGQGKTEGYHERDIPFRPRLVRALGSEAGLLTFGAISKERIKQVSIIQRILSHAIQTFVARGESDNSRPERRRYARPWLNRLDAAVDTDFFDSVQAEFEAPSEERATVGRLWLLQVVDTARDLLSDACDSLPCPAIHRYRARTSAESLFEGRIRGPKGLPFLFTRTTDDHN
jgi:CRISPR system Cascade subunit CasA